MASLKARFQHARQSFSDWLGAHPRTEAFILIPTIGALYAIYGVLICARWVYTQVKRGIKRWKQRHLLKPDEIARRKKLRQARDAVRELPEMRPRRLTIGGAGAQRPETEQDLRAVSPDDGRKKHGKKTRRRFLGETSTAIAQMTIDQLGKSLFWRLPFEVREEIWKYAVGYHHIHIVRRRGRLGNVYCPADDPMDPLRRDLCLESRDEDGFYQPTAWPRDVRPLSLLLSCRQIYSESVDFVYQLNTFAFDEPSTLHTFLTRLLPHRRRLISHMRISPNFGSDLYIPKWGALSRPYMPFNGDSTMWALPKLQSLAVTPTLHRLSPVPQGSRQLVDSIQSLLQELSTVECEAPYTLWWPGTDSRSYGGYTWWGRDDYLPATQNYELRRIPERFSVALMAFLFPIHVQCLHCAPSTIIRKMTRGCVEATYFGDAMGELVPVSADPTLARYCTFHTQCGGWIELEYAFQSGEWRVTQGGRVVGDEDVTAHEAVCPERYPPMPSPHQLLLGLTKRGGYGWGNTSALDLPTYEAFYRNAGWSAPPKCE